METFQKIRHNSKYRNNLPTSSLNLNLSGIKNLKSINSLYTTINIVNNYKNKKDKKSTNNSSKEAETLDSRRFQRRTKNYKIINNQNKLSISITIIHKYIINLKLKTTSTFFLLQTIIFFLNNILIIFLFCFSNININMTY